MDYITYINEVQRRFTDVIQKEVWMWR